MIMVSHTNNFRLHPHIQILARGIQAPVWQVCPARELKLLFKFNWCFRAVLSSWPSWGEEVGNAEESPSQMQTKGGGWSPVQQSLNSRPAWLLLLFSLLLRQQFGCKFSYGLICSVLEYSLLLDASTLSLQEGWAWSLSSGLRVSSSGMKSAWCCESEKHHLEPPCQSRKAAFRGIVVFRGFGDLVNHRRNNRIAVASCWNLLPHAGVSILDFSFIAICVITYLQVFGAVEI